MKKKTQDDALALFEPTQLAPATIDGLNRASDAADASHDDHVDASVLAMSAMRATRDVDAQDRAALLRLVEARGLAWLLGQLADDCARQASTSAAPLAGKLRLVGLSLRYLGDRGEGPIVVERR